MSLKTGAPRKKCVDSRVRNKILNGESSNFRIRFSRPFDFTRDEESSRLFSARDNIPRSLLRIDEWVLQEYKASYESDGRGEYLR